MVSEKQLRDKILQKKEKISILKSEITTLENQLPTHVQTRGDPVVRMMN